MRAHFRSNREALTEVGTELEKLIHCPKYPPILMHLSATIKSQMAKAWPIANAA